MECRFGEVKAGTLGLPGMSSVSFPIHSSQPGKLIPSGLPLLLEHEGSALWSPDLLRWKARILGAPCTTLGPLSRFSVIHRESHRQASWFGSIPIGLYQLGEHESCFCNSSLWNIITVWHLRMAWSADLARLRLGPLGLPLLVERGIVQACSNSQLTFPIRIEINWC